METFSSSVQKVNLLPSLEVYKETKQNVSSEVLHLRVELS